MQHFRALWNIPLKSWIARRWTALSLKNAAPETIALSIVAGLMLGVFPMYGVPTLLCLALTVVGRPHIPLLHAINAVTSPLQLALILPFHWVGEHVLPMPIANVADTRLGLVVYYFSARVVTGWFLICAPLGIGLYLALAYLLPRHKMWKRLGVARVLACPKSI